MDDDFSVALTAGELITRLGFLLASIVLISVASAVCVEIGERAESAMQWLRLRLDRRPVRKAKAAPSAPLKLPPCPPLDEA